MPARSLLFYPDLRLRLRADPVDIFDDELRRNAQDLVDTLAAVSALGLAGPHVGWKQRVVVLRLEPGMPASIYVNPVIVWASPERAPQTEGSVSMPGIAETVDRAVAIRVSFHDVEGGVREEAAEGFSAACLQHEIDQLDGIFWIARLSRLKRERAIRRFGKLQRAS